jgi:transposase
MPHQEAVPRFIGLDLPTRLGIAGMIDDRGRFLARHRLGCTRPALEAFARSHLRCGDRVAVEATTNTWEVVAILKPFVTEVVVSNPLRTKVIATAKIKTDKVDALVLAQLLRCDFLPRVWEPSAPTQRLRRLTGRRASLVMDATTLKNRIHALLHQRLLVAPVKNLFCKAARAWLKTLRLDPAGQALVASDLRLLAAVEQEIAQQDTVLAQDGYANPQVKLLLTLPGVDLVVAQTLLATLGDVSRFTEGAHAASSLGLVPTTRQSASSCYHGRITKQGTGHARAMRAQAAQRVGVHPGPLGACFRRLLKRKNRNGAIVATARKLVGIAGQRLVNNEPYRYAQPSATQTKFSRLRLKATGERLKCGVVAGSVRPASFGSGRRTKPLPSLPQVLRSAGVPPAKSLAQLPPGALRILRKTFSLAFVKQLQHSQRRIARARGGATATNP